LAGGASVGRAPTPGRPARDALLWGAALVALGLRLATERS